MRPRVVRMTRPKPQYRLVYWGRPFRPRAPLVMVWVLVNRYILMR